MIFVSPRPADAELARYYTAGYYGKPGEDSGGLRDGGSGACSWPSASRRASRRGRALPDGFSTSAAARARSRRDGAGRLGLLGRRGLRRRRPDPRRRGPGLHILDKPLEDCALEPASFDLITLWHSIEHVPDPEALLRRAAALLNDGGTLFLAFPNPASWDFALFGPRWFHLDPPRHLHYFSPETLRPVLERCGLEIVGRQPRVLRI